MKKPQINNVMGVGTIGLTLLVMTGCLGTKYLSEGITKEGHVQADAIVFPELDDAWQKEGQFANSENLSKVKAGIGKDELYQLIGRPHFSEAQHAREWDYILKFYQPDESVKVCQFKVIFDNHYKGQEFYWHPSDCPPKKVEVASQMPAKETINLAADALFGFDKWKTQDMLSQGQHTLDELAQKLRGYQNLEDIHIVITGHTDYLGDDAYNMSLSQLRAQTVRHYLASQGVGLNSMIATGAGESEPVKQCSSNQPRRQLIQCLQPNRRVTLEVTVVK